MSDFQKRLKKSIANTGLTLDEISLKSEVSRKTIENWTRKADPTMPSINQGVLVAMAIGVSAEYLVTGKTPNELSEKGLKVALAAEKLSDDGKKVALAQVESLIALFPRGVSANLEEIQTQKKPSSQ